LNKFRANKRVVKEESVTSNSSTENSIRGILKQVSMKFGFITNDSDNEEDKCKVENDIVEINGRKTDDVHSENRSNSDDSDSDSTKSELGENVDDKCRENDDSRHNLNKSNQRNDANTDDLHSKGLNGDYSDSHITKLELEENDDEKFIENDDSRRNLTITDAVVSSNGLQYPLNNGNDGSTLVTASDPAVTFDDLSTNTDISPSTRELFLEERDPKSSVKVDAASNKVYPEKVLAFSKSFPSKVFALDQQIQAEQKRKKRSLF